MGSFFRADRGRKFRQNDHRHEEHYGSGHQFEKDMLYKNNVQLPTFEEIQKNKMSLRDALVFCMERNPNKYSEEMKPSQWIEDIKRYLLAELHAPESALEIYPAAGTPADLHGIDLFLIYTDPETDIRVMLTVDLTENEIKLENSYKADVIVSSEGAVPHEHYYGGHVTGFLLSDKYVDNRDDYQARRQARRQHTARVMAEIIQDKVTSGDHHYERLMQAMRGDLHRILGTGILDTDDDDTDDTYIYGRGIANAKW